MLSKNNLLHFRNEINNIDKKIVTLLAKRKKLVLNIAQFKIKNKQPIRDINREKNLLAQLINFGKKKSLDPDYIMRLFQLIIKESVFIQEILLKNSESNKNIKKCTFSFLGPKGSYSHIATSKYSKKNLITCIEKECLSFKDVVQSVENNNSTHAILPIENSCSGPINEMFNILKNINLFIVGEINISIDHCLLAIKNVELNIIKTIYSHSQPFKQCSNFINQFPHWIIKHTNSTTDAIIKVIKYNKISNAVIGSKLGNKIYGLNILSQNISNQKNNITRFICLSKKPDLFIEKVPVKTTIIFNLNKNLKIISEIVSILKQKKISSKILTFQNIYCKNEEQIFYLDIEDNLSSNIIQNIIHNIKKNTKFIKILGSYPI